jgi:hypothetical protein
MITGSAFALARWFQPERYADRPEDDFVREEILSEVYNAEACAVHDGTVLVRTPSGACCIEKIDADGSPLVTFDYVSNTNWTRTKFWMNASSVRDLGDRLRAVPRASFDALFVGSQS